MKFHTSVDAQTFLTEIGLTLNEAMEATADLQPTNEEISTFISVRTPLVKKIKNYRQASASKDNWKKNRFKIMRGIKSFHASVDGKRFHRKLGRFLATRITRDRLQTDSVFDKHEALVGLNSLKQHLIVELGYYHSLYEQVELEELVLENAVPMLSSIENKVLNDEPLTEDEVVFLTDMINKNTFLDCLAEVLGEKFENLQVWCETINSDLEKQGITKESPEYFIELIKGLVLSSNETKNGL